MNKYYKIMTATGLLITVNYFNTLAYGAYSPKSVSLNKYSISGISSGGFMASQMATAFSSRFSGVGNIVGGFYYCAEDHFLTEHVKSLKIGGLGDASLFAVIPDSQIIKEDAQALSLRPRMREYITLAPQNPLYQAMGKCMMRPHKTEIKWNKLKQLAKDNNIDDLVSLKVQKVFSYHGKNDDVMIASMQEKLNEFYDQAQIPKENRKNILSEGAHNFPTNKSDLTSCNEEELPYLASCNYDLAGDILGFMGLLNSSSKNKPSLDKIYMIDQTLNFENVKMAIAESELQKAIDSKETTEDDYAKFIQKSSLPKLKRQNSVAPYGYLYAPDNCLNNPSSCKVHVALHGCKMSDSFEQAFQEKYERQLMTYNLPRMRSEKDNSIFTILLTNSLLKIEDKQNQMGLLEFVLKSGYIEYAESNNLMILFPQTWIGQNHFPYNPKGCWDWYGWTDDVSSMGSYPTKNGNETSWMMAFIDSVAQNPSAHILPLRPPFEMARKIWGNQ